MSVFRVFPRFTNRSEWSTNHKPRTLASRSYLITLATSRVLCGATLAYPKMKVSPEYANHFSFQVMRELVNVMRYKFIPRPTGTKALPVLLTLNVVYSMEEDIHCHSSECPLSVEPNFVESTTIRGSSDRGALSLRRTRLQPCQGTGNGLLYCTLATTRES
jgi:hypothetical protein